MDFLARNRSPAIQIILLTAEFCFQVPDVAALHAICGAVYIKYNAGSGSAYASLYTGRDRGVLLTLGQQQIGHLPLGLFDEAMAAPPPQL